MSRQGARYRRCQFLYRVVEVLQANMTASTATLTLMLGSDLLLANTAAAKDMSLSGLQLLLSLGHLLPVATAMGKTILALPIGSDLLLANNATARESSV